MALSRAHVQAKLSINPAGDEYEREADAVADRVTGMSESAAPSRFVGAGGPALQAKGAATGAAPSVTAALQTSGAGSALTDSVRSRIEPVLGSDLSGVRVHDDGVARDAARDIGAKAFTHRNHIFLGEGQSAADPSLMAHEATHVVQQGATGGRIQRNPITEADLPSPSARGISADEQARRTFMRDVYRRQVLLWTSRNASYVHEILPADRTTLPASYVMAGRAVSVLSAVAGPVQQMLDAARAELGGVSGPGGPAADIDALAVRSGYRSATEQFSIWRRFAPRYYRHTQAHRRTLPGGEHGAAAAQYLAEYTNERVFSPGYSAHQHGIAVDLTYKYRSGLAPAGTEQGGWAPASSDPVWVDTWRRSWFFGWLWRNAPRFGFVRNPDINEPWHWEFRPGTALILNLIRWLLTLLDGLLGTDWGARFDDYYGAGQGPIGSEEDSAPE